MGVVAVVGLVLDVGSRDGDTTFPLLRSLVNGAILKKAGIALLCLSLGDGSREGGLGMIDQYNRYLHLAVYWPLSISSYLSVIDVTDGSDVDVGLISLECGGISSCGGQELRLAPGAQGALDGVG